MRAWLRRQSPNLRSRTVRNGLAIMALALAQNLGKDMRLDHRMLVSPPCGG
jgi:hypothetical protein